MAYKFKKWRIRWQKGTKKFKKIRRDRTKSRAAHYRFIRNRGRMKKGLRIARRKGRLQIKKNKAAGIYKKMALARKRWKNIIKSDVNLDNFLDRLDEELNAPELEIIADKDLDGVIQILQDIKKNIKLDDDEDQEELKKFVDDTIEVVHGFKNLEDLESEDEAFFNDILSFIEEYGEEAGYIEDDDSEEYNDDEEKEDPAPEKKESKSLEDLVG